MGQITVKRDPNIELPNIVVQLHATDSSETDQPENRGEVMQTKVTGIVCPLLAINGIAFDYNDIDYLELNMRGAVPVLGFRVQDRRNQFAQLYAPGTSNEIQLQILPSFDKAYKKVNMLFFIHDFHIEDGQISGVGIFKCKNFVNSQFKCFGKISTYELFDQISNETGLGLASNIDDTNDQRFIYCDHKSFHDILKTEIKKSGADETHVYDWWIDLWNNLILCDMYDRYHSDDNMEDNQIWVSTSNNEQASGDETRIMKSDPVFSNHYSIIGSDLYVGAYEKITETQRNFFKGTSRIISAYNAETKDCVDHIVADGDIKEDEFVKYEYAGEFYGGYNYLFAEECRDMYIQKMNSEIIEIVLRQPLLSIMKGDQIRLVWYDNDAEAVMNRRNLEENAGLTPVDQLDLGWLKEWNDIHNNADLDNPMSLNLQVSGQYTIIGQFLTYNAGYWVYKLRLSRPASKKIQIIPEE